MNGKDKSPTDQGIKTSVVSKQR